MAPDDRLPRSAASSRSVHLDAIAKSFGAKLAVDLAALTIAEGEFLTLLGPSGCGKTTLLMIIAGFLQPDRGTIRIGTRDITALAPEKRNFGMVFQGYALFPHLSVRDNVAYPLRRRGMDKHAAVQRVNAILDKVQLSALAGRLPRQLSGGQQQRVALARAIVFEPDLVLLDEPLSALDTGLRHDLQVELKTLHRQTGMTFVCVTHDQDEALSMSDRIAVMRDARIVQLATPQELYNRPKSRFVANFMGAKNIIRATVSRVDGDQAICAASEITLVQKVAGSLAPGSAVTLALRPESLAINDASRRNQVRGTVEALSYVGLETVLTVASPLGMLTVRQNSSTLDRNVAIGTAVTVGWAPDAAMVVEDD